MAYEAHKWKIGEEITSEKLNHIEKGIEEAGLHREITDPQDGQTLKYDAASGKWVNADVPAAIETNIQNPTDGQTLKYDAESGKWINGEGGGNTKLVVNQVYDSDEGAYLLDKTWQEIADAYPNVVIQRNNGEELLLVSLIHRYKITTIANENYVAQSASDFPVLDEIE